MAQGESVDGREIKPHTVAPQQDSGSGAEHPLCAHILAVLARKTPQ